MMQAKSEFKFFTRLNLTELTGLRAANLFQFLELIKSVPGSSIYHHTHRFLQQHHFLSPEPPNDFAYWVKEVLGEDELGERLASIDTVRFANIRSLREEIVNILEEYIRDNPLSRIKFAKENEVFHFNKSISFVIPTVYTAWNLEEFLNVLKQITIDSIYYHMFEARLRLEKASNDFSLWIEDSLGRKELALQISRLDPYTFTLEDLRLKLIKLIKEEMSYGEY